MTDFEMISILETRFKANMESHKKIQWVNVQKRLEIHPGKLGPLKEMEKTGGEPDVVGLDEGTGEYIFYDCSSESPKGRRNVCYDREALESRKEHKPRTANS